MRSRDDRKNTVYLPLFSSPITQPENELVLVIDLEWDWLDKNGHALKFDECELIEIGAVVASPQSTDPSGHSVVFDQLIMPESKNKLSSKFQQLTGITYNQLTTDSVPLVNALESFFTLATKYDSWATWGSRDIDLLKSAAKRAGLTMPMPKRMTDIKRVFCKSNRVKKSPSLTRAMCMIGAHRSGKIHRAASDALIAAKLLSHTMQELQVDKVSDDEFERWLHAEYPELLQKTPEDHNDKPVAGDLLAIWQKNRPSDELAHLDLNVVERPGIWYPLFDIQQMLQGRDPDNLSFSGFADSTKNSDEIRIRAARYGEMRLAKMPMPQHLFGLDELLRRFSNFKYVILEIKGALLNALYSHTPIRFDPILLDGPPGVGKTEFALQLASVLGLPFMEFNIASVHGKFEVSGGHPSWSQSEPGRVTKFMLEQPILNPIILMDELELARSVAHDDVTQPLLQFLDREQARRVTDHNLNMQFDYSSLCFIATTNELSFVSNAMRSRFHVFEIEPPTPEQTVEIAENIYAKLRTERGALYLSESLDRNVSEQLAALPPRAIRSALSHAMNLATLRLESDATLNPGAIGVEDLPNCQQSKKISFGFVPRTT